MPCPGLSFTNFPLEIQRNIASHLPYTAQWALARTSKHCLSALDIRQSKDFFPQVEAVWTRIRASIDVDWCHKDGIGRQATLDY